MARNYTVRRHIARLKIIFDQPDLCNLCPAMLMYNKDKFKHIPWTNNPCKVCYTFIGLKALSHWAGLSCPCKQLGQEEAVRLTLKALKEFRLKGQRLTFLRK